MDTDGSGPSREADRHYVWNDDGTRLVEKVGPIDMTRPFFLACEIYEAPEGWSADESTGWPSDWRVVGATDGAGLRHASALTMRSEIEEIGRQFGAP